MVKKSNRFLVVSVVSLVLVLSIVGLIIAAPSAKYQSVSYGHGADQIYVTYQGNSQTALEDAINSLNSRVAALVPAPEPRDSNGCIISSQKWCGSSNSCIAQSATCTPTVTPVTFDFLVRVSSGIDVSSIDACPAGYDWVAHIHGRLPTGTALHSFEVGNDRQTRDGWMALCTRTPDRLQKDITTVITSNLCGGAITGTSCPAGYSQIGTFTRSTGQCGTPEPQLGGDTRDSSLSVNLGTLIVCQKGVPEYLVKSGTDLCGSDTTLGHVIKTSGSQSTGYFSFCKSG